MGIMDEWGLLNVYSLKLRYRNSVLSLIQKFYTQFDVRKSYICTYNNVKYGNQADLAPKRRRD